MEKDGLTFTTKNIIPKEQNFICKISPKPYKNASELQIELQRCLNPPLVNKNNNELFIDDIQILITQKEYSNHNELCTELENCINSTMKWNDNYQKIHVRYSDGFYTFSRITPFKMTFSTNSILKILGFRHYLFYGKSKYTSHYETFNILNANNRYIINYNSYDDIFIVKPFSQLNYLQFNNLQFPIQLSRGFNVEIPFRLCDSSLTKQFGFKLNNNNEYQSCEISSLLMPHILYLTIDEIDNCILTQNFKCMSILYHKTEKNYKSHKNEMNAIKNIFKNNLDKITIKLFNQRQIEYFGINYCIVNLKLII